MVMSTCSLTLKGPGFKVNSHFDPCKNTLFVIFAAMSWPKGTTAIWAEIAVIVNGSLLYQKNWFKNDNKTHESVPKNHIRKVRTGSEGSSVVVTVRATCLIGEFSSSDFELDVMPWSTLDTAKQRQFHFLDLKLSYVNVQILQKCLLFY